VGATTACAVDGLPRVHRARERQHVQRVHVRVREPVDGGARERARDHRVVRGQRLRPDRAQVPEDLRAQAGDHVLCRKDEDPEEVEHLGRVALGDSAG
jgi:hypothetical protein